ncbi:MAG: lysophospholipid acyltransferase family protein [Verrucomicrobia bacterium]|nr:lysophospholipid acyltransferase family protein [Verrucomicrobiota bacterium]
MSHRFSNKPVDPTEGETRGPQEPRDAILSLKDRAQIWCVSWVGWAFLQFIALTSRIRTVIHPAAQKFGEGRLPHIVTFWHRYQLLLAYERRERGICVLVSRSLDGEYACRMLHRYGFVTARGSSSRGGVGALLELVRHVRNGGQVGVTPDGPKGPLRSVQPGVVRLAIKTGAPIIPTAWAGTRVKELHCWDRFLIPKPFGHYAVYLGAPLFLTEEAGAEEKVCQALNAAEAEAQRLLPQVKAGTI